MGAASGPGAQYCEAKVVVHMDGPMPLLMA